MKKVTILILSGLILAGFTAFSQTYLVQVKPAGARLWGYANHKGDVVIEPKFDKCAAFSADGLAPVYDKQARQYYFINTNGSKLETEVSGFKIKDGLGFDIQGFTDGLVQIKIGEKWGYMDKNGRMAIQAKYDETSEFDGGYAITRNGTNFMVIDLKGNETAVNAPEIIDIKGFTEGRAIFKTNTKKTGFIGTDGKIAIPAQFESVGYFKAGLAWAKSGEKLGYINLSGEWVIQPRFEAGKNFDSQSGLARVKSGDLWSYVNKSGEMISVTGTETFGDFSEGLADGKKGDKKGFYNHKGIWEIEARFDGLRDFKNGFAAAKKGELWGMIDKQGNWVFEPKFEAIKDMELVK